MKNVCFTLALVLVFVSALNGQTLLCSYPLSSDAVDVTGNNPDVFLDNAPFQNGGVYSNGIYYGDEPTGARIETPLINNFDFDDFTVIIDFFIEEYPANKIPIIMGGPTWRWVGSYVDKNGKVSLVVNNMSDSFNSDEVATLNQWHTLAFSYNHTSKELQLYLDNNLVLNEIVPILEHGDNENKFLNANWGNGDTYKGYWRNLKIYNSSTVVGIFHNHELDGIEVLVLRNALKIMIPQTEKDIDVQLIDMRGVNLRSTRFTPGSNMLDVSGLKTGNYILLFTNPAGRKSTKEITLIR